MVSKRRFFAVLLSLLFLAVCIVAVPAFATEDGGVVPYAQNGDDGPVYFPTPQAPPTPTPTPTPTPMPTPTPTPTPTPEPPAEITPAPQDPNGGGAWENQPNYDPTPTPTPTPTPRPGGITITPTPSPSDGPTPATPPTVVRPIITPKPSGAADTSPEDDESGDGTNYVTFAQLNMKNNSLAVTLFYGGLVLAVLGGGGLIILIVRLATKRKEDGKFSVVLDLDETGSTAPRIPSNTPELVTGPGRTVRVDPSRATMPAKSSTHQTHPSRPPFAGTDIQSSSQGFTPAESLPVQSPANAPIVPSAASYYTEEFSLETEKKHAPPAPAPTQEPQPEEKKQPEIETPPAPQQSLASRLRAARARPAEPPDAPSRPPKSGNPVPPAKQQEKEDSSGHSDVSPAARPEPSEMPKRETEKPPEKTITNREEAKNAPAQEPENVPARKLREDIPAEKTASTERPKETPKQPAVSKKPSRSKDTPEQITFQQPEKDSLPGPAEESESKKKPDKEVPGQISFLE